MKMQAFKMLELKFRNPEKVYDKGKKIEYENTTFSVLLFSPQSLLNMLIKNSLIKL